ncbi:Collagen alpha-1(II) chain-like [Abeliophyllum distichum]|uniref:Collagen alpha-1(II) chain-like n=1 Tax=Abeliophyllum distichum TaxID=126358 RepID=A0ABD1VTP7_9LAMI
MMRVPNVTVITIALLFLLSIKPYVCARILYDEEKEWTKIEQHLLLPSLQSGTPSSNSCSYIPGGSGRPCKNTVGEKNFAGRVVSTPSSLSSVPPPPPLPHVDTNAYPNQIIQFKVAADDPK